MHTHLQLFKTRPPQIVFEWNDHETDARGWVVINSLRGGAAGGGTRMRKGLDKAEVESLAKVMEIKFTVSGPAIGGAKSGINFDPNDPRKEEVLKRWFAAVSPLLENYYGTGGDLNIDEVKDVIPLTEEYGIWHPQEGIVTGHFKPTEADKIRRIGNLRSGVSKIVEDLAYNIQTGNKYAVADLITGYGVAKSIIHFYHQFKNESIVGKRVLIQGWGNVAAPAAYYLGQAGAKLVGILDRHCGIITEDGFETDQIKELISSRKGNELYAQGMLGAVEAGKKFWSTPADIFIPAAASKLIKKEHIDSLLNAGVETLSCGANVPFADPDVFFGELAEYADAHLSLIPDFIANCGMARVFAYLMGNKDVEISDASIFEDVSETIKNALLDVKAKSPAITNITQTSLNIALEKIFR